MKTIKIGALIATALLVTACDKAGNSTGATASSGASQSSGISDKSDVARDSTLTVDKNSSIVVKAPAWLLITRAVNELNVDSYCNDKLVCDQLKMTQDAFNLAQQSVVSFDNKKLLSAVMRGDNYAKKWAEEKAANLLYVSKLSELISSSINSKSARSEQETIDQIKDTIVELAKTKELQNLYASFVDDKSTPKFNLSGQQKHPVEFVLNGNLYGQDANGWSVTKSGLQYFGSGKIQGKDIEIAMTDSDSNSLSKKTNIATSKNNETRTNTEASAGAK